MNFHLIKCLIINAFYIAYIHELVVRKVALVENLFSFSIWNGWLSALVVKWCVIIFLAAPLSSWLLFLAIACKYSSLPNYLCICFHPSSFKNLWYDINQINGVLDWHCEIFNLKPKLWSLLLLLLFMIWCWMMTWLWAHSAWNN